VTVVGSHARALALGPLCLRACVRACQAGACTASAAPEARRPPGRVGCINVPPPHSNAPQQCLPQGNKLWCAPSRSPPPPSPHLNVGESAEMSMLGGSCAGGLPLDSSAALQKLARSCKRSWTRGLRACAKGGGGAPQRVVMRWRWQWWWWPSTTCVTSACGRILCTGGFGIKRGGTSATCTLLTCQGLCTTNGGCVR